MTVAKTEQINKKNISQKRTNFDHLSENICHLVSSSGCNNGILLPKLFWPTVWKNCSIDREKLWKIEAEGREFAKFLRSLEQFVQTVKVKNNFWYYDKFEQL